MYEHTLPRDRTTPSPTELIARAEAMVPVLRKRAGDADRNSKLAPETVQELRDVGFFRILQPPKFGGYGMRPSTLWEVTRHLGRGCGSTPSRPRLRLDRIHCLAARRSFLDGRNVRAARAGGSFRRWQRRYRVQPEHRRA